MKPDLRHAEIRPPTKDDLPGLCRILAEAWPQETWIWDGVAAGTFKPYTWTPLCMVAGDDVVGTVARFDINIWWHGEPIRVAGVGSVATPKYCRRMGIARRLLDALTDRIDADGCCSVLFTGLPDVYIPHGFREIDQGYVTLYTGEVPIDTHGLRAEQRKNVDAETLARMGRLYNGPYPNYDGKIIRDEAYWRLYEEFFNRHTRAQIIFCRDGDRDTGYVRVEEESDRLLISAFCCAPDDAKTLQALLDFAHKAAVGRGLDRIALSLPREHVLRDFLASQTIIPEPETGAHREVFMVRQRRERQYKPHPVPGLENLRWSLADKF